MDTYSALPHHHKSGQEMFVVSFHDTTNAVGLTYRLSVIAVVDSSILAWQISLQLMTRMPLKNVRLYDLINNLPSGFVIIAYAAY
jgi:hypothetical protein